MSSSFRCRFVRLLSLCRSFLLSCLPSTLAPESRCTRAACALLLSLLSLSLCLVGARRAPQREREREREEASGRRESDCEREKRRERERKSNIETSRRVQLHSPRVVSLSLPLFSPSLFASLASSSSPAAPLLLRLRVSRSREQGIKTRAAVVGMTSARARDAGRLARQQLTS